MLFSVCMRDSGRGWVENISSDVLLDAALRACMTWSWPSGFSPIFVMYFRPSLSDSCSWSRSKPTTSVRVFNNCGDIFPAATIFSSFLYSPNNVKPLLSNSMPFCLTYLSLKCLAVTCPISWPRTPASWAFEVSFERRPRVIKTLPPGRANALMVLEFKV